MLKNTDSGKQGEAQIEDIIEDYLSEKLGDNGGLIDEYTKLDLSKEGHFYPQLPYPSKGLVDADIKKDGLYQIDTSGGYSLLIVNENKNKGSVQDSGSILDTYIYELESKVPKTIRHYQSLNRWSVVVGLFTMTGLPRLKNWNWNDTELRHHLHQHKIWMNRQPGKANIHAELDDIFDYYATEIDWDDRQPLPTHLKQHLGIR